MPFLSADVLPRFLVPLWAARVRFSLGDQTPHHTSTAIYHFCAGRSGGLHPLGGAQLHAPWRRCLRNRHNLPRGWWNYRGQLDIPAYFHHDSSNKFLPGTVSQSAVVPKSFSQRAARRCAGEARAPIAGEILQQILVRIGGTAYRPGILTGGGRAGKPGQARMH